MVVSQSINDILFLWPIFTNHNLRQRALQSVQGVTSSLIYPRLLSKKHHFTGKKRKEIKTQGATQVRDPSPRKDRSAIDVTCSRACHQNNNIQNIYEKR